MHTRKSPRTHSPSPISNQRIKAHRFLRFCTDNIISRYAKSNFYVFVRYKDCLQCLIFLPSSSSISLPPRHSSHSLNQKEMPKSKISTQSYSSLGAAAGGIVGGVIAGLVVSIFFARRNFKPCKASFAIIFFLATADFCKPSANLEPSSERLQTLSLLQNKLCTDVMFLKCSEMYALSS
jgi:hypothetical protein